MLSWLVQPSILTWKTSDRQEGTSRRKEKRSQRRGPLQEAPHEFKDKKAPFHRIHAPLMQFGRAECSGPKSPHNDALVIIALLAITKCIFIDLGNSADINVWRGVRSNAARRHPSRDSEHLPLRILRRATRRTYILKFLVVDTPSAYNVILGRPNLNDFQAVEVVFKGQKRSRNEDPEGPSNKLNEESPSNRHDREVPPRKREKGDNKKSEDKKTPSKIVPGDPEKFTCIGSQLEEMMQEEIIKCLCRKSDIFAWTPQDIEGIDPNVITHHLNINPRIKLVKQKKRHLGHEKDKIIQFPEWLSNMVLVPKLGGKWRMCIDFRDLNKACPKDFYLSLESINCMMSASQGYHQIMLAPKDRKRVSFITSAGTFYYIAMPFGLKNAGATYQRLVDKIFHPQLERNMKVYIDDMLVKSKETQDHVTDMDETFVVLKKYRLKLNPEKMCIWSKGRVLLRIHSDPERNRSQPYQNQGYPRHEGTLQHQRSTRLTGRIAVLSSSSLNQWKRVCPSSKSSERQKIEWDNSCQQAFEDFKQYLAGFPLLGGRKMPIYYVSKVLNGVEGRYTIIENMALALVTTARRLRTYFLSHPIEVKTNLPLKQMLGKPNASGDLTTINAQALANFVSKMTGTSEERTSQAEKWLLHVDGSSTFQSSGTGIVLTSPQGEDLEFTVKFRFKAFNNEAEYEALVVRNGDQKANWIGGFGNHLAIFMNVILS
ncbi:UNVERIFIED_CONTAM: Retrovirus-related Pol polyprotein from transposon opus [Sesamum indicum]